MYVLKQNIANLDKSYVRVRQAKAQGKRITECYMQAAQSYGESFAPLQNFSSIINQVFTMKNNVVQLNKTLKQFVNLGAEVNTLIDKLSDSKKILDVYKRLVILIRLRTSLVSKFKSTEFMNQNNMNTKIKSLEKELSGIKQLETKFLEKMHGYMENHQMLIQKQPAYFIKIMRIIECDSKLCGANSESQKSKPIFEEVEGEGKDEEGKEHDDEQIYNDCRPSGALKLKESCLKVLSDSVMDQAVTAYKSAFSVDEIIDVSERLIKSLRNVERELGHVFPPSYNIAKIYFYAYKEIILKKISPYVDNMDKLIENDKGLLLLLVAFSDSSGEMLEKLKIQDDSLFNLKVSLSRFVPIFLEHIEHLLEDWLINARKQFYKQYDRILSVRESNIGLERMSEVGNLWTSMPNDIFTFIQRQFDLVAAKLSGNHLFEVLKISISKFTWLMSNMSEKSEKIITQLLETGPTKESRGFEAFIIYINDFSEIINIYEDFFQEYIITKVVETEKDEETRAISKERANTILYTTYREILANRQDMIRRFSRYVLIHDLERDDFIYLFTQRWEGKREDNIISNTLATVLDYLKEVESCLKQESSSSIIKAMTSSFLSVLLSEAYFLKLLISINKRNKLKLPLPDENYMKELLPLSYQESLLKKADKDKIIKNEDGYFISVTMLIEGIQKDKDLIQSFRERNTDIVQSSVANKLLSQYSTIIIILSTIHSSNEHILDILELLPDYAQSFAKVPYSKQLLMAVMNIDSQKIQKSLLTQYEAIIARYEELALMQG